MVARNSRQAQPAEELAHLAEPVDAPLVDDAELQIPLSSQAVFWRPRLQASSPMLGQIPFLFWLAESARPNTILQIGLGDGIVYLGLCQASERIGSGTFCLGLASEDPALPPQAFVQHGDQYADFSRLISGSLQRTRDAFEGELDFLVLNRKLDADDLEELRNHWLPRLSERAVVLICDPDTVFPEKSARDEMFSAGVRQIHMAAVSPGGHAVDLLLVGRNPSDRLLKLAAQRPGKPAYLASRQVFNRLGQGLEAGQQALSAGKREKSGQAELQAAKASLKAQTDQIGDLRREIEAARTAEKLEIARQAEVSSRLSDLETEIAKNEGVISDLRSEILRLTSAHVDQEAALSAERSAREAHQRDADEKSSAIALLEATQKDLEGQLASAKTDKADMLALKDRAEQERADLLNDLAAKEGAINGLQASLKELEGRFDSTVASVQERIEDIAVLGALLEKRQAAYQNDIAAKDSTIARLQAAHMREIRGRDTAITQLHAGQKQIQDQLTSARAAERKSNDEVAALKAKADLEYSSYLVEITEKNKTIEQGNAARNALEKIRNELLRENQKLVAYRDEVLKSSSWKVTKPLRSLKRAFTRE